MLARQELRIYQTVLQYRDYEVLKSSHLSSGPDCLAEHFSPFFLVRFFLLLDEEFFLPVFFPVFLFFSLGFLVLVLFFFLFFLFFKFPESFLLPSVDLLALPDTEWAG